MYVSTEAVAIFMVTIGMFFGFVFASAAGVWANRNLIRSVIKLPEALDTLEREHQQFQDETKDLFVKTEDRLGVLEADSWETIQRLESLIDEEDVGDDDEDDDDELPEQYKTQGDATSSEQLDKFWRAL